jgi:diguanylate cyclase (GGDEF)-like protein
VENKSNHKSNYLFSAVGMKILLVEDDAVVAESLAAALTNQHYAVDIAEDGQIAWELSESCTYDLILLDLILPKLDGISFCQRLRYQKNFTPILILTAKAENTDKIIGLDAGADDYLTKPFETQELLARIRALLRRGSSVLSPILEWGDLQLNPNSCEVAWNDEVLHLTPKEYALLELFLRNPNRIFSNSILIDRLWSFDEAPTPDTVRSHLKGLRMKLKAAGVVEDPIETVYGIGYRLKTEEKIKGKKSKNLSKNLGSNASESILESKIEIAEAGIRNVWQRSRSDVKQRVVVIGEAVNRLEKNKLSKKLRSQAEEAAHKLVGSLGMFGSDEGSRIAQEIEVLFSGDSSLQQTEDKQKLSQLLTSLRQEVDKINLPIISQPPSITPQLTSQLSQNSTDAKLMLVDDDTQFLVSLQTLLTPWGFRVTTLDNPILFWDSLAVEQPDLLVLDVRMPHFTGIYLCNVLRNDPHWSRLPILFLSAYGNADTIHQAFAYGADDFISKPVVGPELVARIINRLERTRLLRSLAEIDVLTGVCNRTKSSQQLEEMFSWSDRHHQPFTLAIITLDRLKRINRQYGHGVGDRILSKLGELLRQTFQGNQIIGRWGGKEFILGIPGIGKDEVMRTLYHILDNFRQLEFVADNGISFHTSFSAGVVSYPDNGTDLQALYEAADLLLEQAKANGRNQIL